MAISSGPLKHSCNKIIIKQQIGFADRALSGHIVLQTAKTSPYMHQTVVAAGVCREDNGFYKFASIYFI
jgi:hypothetical protein